MSTLLRLSCPDRVGLLALISNFIARHGGNLTEVHQYTDPDAGWFFTRMEIDTRTLAVDLPTLRQEFAPIATELEAEWTIRKAETKRKVIVMGFKKLGDSVGATVYNKFPDHPTEGYKDIWDFIIQSLKAPAK